MLPCIKAILGVSEAISNRPLKSEFPNAFTTSNDKTCIPKDIHVKKGKRALGFMVDGGGSLVASVCPAG